MLLMILNWYNLRVIEVLETSKASGDQATLMTSLFQVFLVLLKTFRTHNMETYQDMLREDLISSKESHHVIGKTLSAKTGLENEKIKYGLIPIR